MPAFGEDGLGVKLVTLTPGNPDAGWPFVQAAYVLFDAATQSLRAVIDGSSLTAIRTAAVWRSRRGSSPLPMPIGW